MKTSIYILVGFVLYSCNSINKSNVESFDTTSNYGFIVENSTGHYFYEIDENLIQEKYSNVDDIETARMLLQKTKSISRIKGYSLEYYSWLIFLDKNKLNQDILNTKSGNKSTVFPVFIAYSQSRLKNKKNKKGYYNIYSDKKVKLENDKSILYILPLNKKQRNEYMNIRDTITTNNKEYKDFLIRNI